MNIEANIPTNAAEFVAKKKPFLLTSSMLYEANSSPFADENRQKFYENWKNGRVVMVRRCSDSRIPTSITEAVDVASMGTGGPKSPYTGLMFNPGIGGIANITHFDGVISEKGKRPTGCGASDGKKFQEEQEINEELDEEHSGLFVSEMKSSDQIVHALFDAEVIARNIEKPILVGTIDHRRLELIPVAAIEKKGTSLNLIIPETLPIRYMLQGKYDPAKIYEFGIPRLDERQIPEQFAGFLEDTRRDYAELRRTYPDLLETQASQSPHTLIVTTEKITPRGRYPGLFDRPGSVFVVHVPGIKETGIELEISDKSVQTALRQSHYAVDHLKVANVIFETANLTQSLKMAEAFCSRKLFNKWCQLEDSQIFSVESTKGRTRQIVEVKLAA